MDNIFNAIYSSGNLWRHLEVEANQFREKHHRQPIRLKISRNDFQKLMDEDAEREKISNIVVGAIAVLVDESVFDGMPIFE